MPFRGSAASPYVAGLFFDPGLDFHRLTWYGITPFTHVGGFIHLSRRLCRRLLESPPALLFFCLDFSAILCYRITPLLWSGVALSLLAAPRPCRRLPPFFQASRLADGLRIAGFLFRAENLTFRVFGVDYVTFLANAFPFLERLRVADGDSLRRLFLRLGT